MRDKHILQAQNGAEIPVTLYMPQNAPTAVVLFIPALGVKARFYDRTAMGLAEAGVAVVLMEQRGHGDSPYRASRTCDFGYQHYLEEDIPTIRAWVHERFIGTPFYMGGHSLGGHMASMAAGLQPAGIEGIFHIACVFPAYRYYEGKSGFLIRYLCAVIRPVTWLLGYYPGEKIGFGAREFRQLMLDWRHWAVGGDYNFGPYPGLEAKMAAYKGRFLSIEVAGDTFASTAAFHKVRSVMAGTTLTAVQLTSVEQGEFTGHFMWAKKPDGAVQAVLRWLHNKG
ncbi:alpha/beta hydrolase family protein [Kordiimonas pumila]|uniref:Alpha/beta fold hydrolase n=1 Tax=Kordiimonas pumila TaxID=2161677 RepID=A0ABV7D0X7_9PROT|nr:alpha/beta fold hydrolase [Kordiimonas pumila]